MRECKRGAIGTESTPIAASLTRRASHSRLLLRPRPPAPRRRPQGVFEGGDACGSGAKRSMRVKFECGLKESAFGASEPSTCAYAATMTTPAACKKRDLRVLEERLEEVEKMGRDAAAARGGAGAGQQQHDEL